MTHLISSIFLFLLALFFLWYRFFGYPEEVVKIEGQLKSYSFKIESDGRGGKNYNYYFFLKEDLKKYKIPAKFIDEFQEVEFKQDMNTGDKISLLINKDANLSGGHFDIYEVSFNSKNYLDRTEAIAVDRLEKNIAIPSFFLLASLIGWLNLRKYKEIKNMNTTV